jgi:hypothetical protein
VNCRGLLTLTALAAALEFSAPEDFADSSPSKDPSAPGGAASKAGSAPGLSDWRASLVSEFPYDTSPAAKAPDRPSRAPEPIQTDSGVAALPAFIVKGSRGDAFPPLQTIPSPNPSTTLVQKLGIGEHEAKLKHATIRWATILYVPFFIQVAW